MMHKAKVAVCSESRTKHSVQGEHNEIFFLILKLMVRKATTRL